MKLTATLLHLKLKSGYIEIFTNICRNITSFFKTLTYSSASSVEPLELLIIIHGKWSKLIQILLLTLPFTIKLMIVSSMRLTLDAMNGLLELICLLPIKRLAKPVNRFTPWQYSHFYERVPEKTPYHTTPYSTWGCDPFWPDNNETTLVGI